MRPAIAVRAAARVLDRLADEHVQFTPAALRSLASQTRAEGIPTPLLRGAALVGAR
jgi:hypothetical protein